LAKEGALDEVCSLFKEAEDNLKEYEYVDDTILLPAVNQLRYAGYHLAKAYKIELSESPGIEELDLNITQARNHCKRSIFDSSEGVLLHHLDEVRQFQLDYSKIAVPDIVPDYIDLCTQITKARDLIREASQVPGDTRHEFYKKCREHVTSLKSITDTLSEARPELNKKVDDRNTSTLRWTFGITLAALGAFAAIFALMVAI